MENVIFLDVDGVLNNYESQSKGIQIIPEKVQMIDRLAQECDAQIILSSTWRMGWSAVEARNFFWRCGLTAAKRFRGFTPVDRKAGNRGVEIDTWLEEHDGFYNNYVILDDDTDDIHQKRNTVKIHGPIGLTPEDVEKARKILSRRS